jgi:hypothetical protein
MTRQRERAAAANGRHPEHPLRENRRQNQSGY